mgnify:CR=1 FL=1
MSFQSFVTERLAAITVILNQIGTNAKKIDELPAQTTLDPASKIHVSKSGTSQSLEIQKIINAISEGNYSQLLSVGEISVTGLVISVPSGAQWVYENINYATSAVTNITETLCATGFLRKDILVANQSNQIVLIKGAESETIRIRPNIPIGTILVTEIDVYDTVVGTPSTPIIGNTSYTKLETDNLLNDKQDTLNEYANLFTYTTGAQTLTVPTTLKAMSVTLNDGRVLKKTIDWERTSTTVITILYALEENDTIYITGLI